MRATFRLVSIWTGVTLVLVGVAWFALGMAVDTATTAPAEVSAFDPSALTPSPADPPGNPTAPSPSPTASPSGKPKGHRPAANATPPPSPTPSVSPTPIVRNHPANTPIDPVLPDPVTRKVKTDGGQVTFQYADNVLSVADVVPEADYASTVEPQPDGSLVVRFVSAKHVSTVHAYLDDQERLRTPVTEEDV